MSNESAASRTAFLAEQVAAADAANEPTYPVPFRQRQIDLRKIEVPIDFPLYNMHNGRTHRAQAQYIEQHGLAEDFFADPEDPDAQRAQGELLLGMAELQRLDEDLAERQQRDPIILTADGFIVNGNRRTAWLRAESGAEHLAAVVLPSAATAPDIYDTEVELQMARETRAEYNWIDQALHVRFGIDEMYADRDPEDTVASIARRMNTAEDDVRLILERLAVVDMYLDWLQQPGKYHLIGAEGQTNALQAFEELRTRVRTQPFRALPELAQRTIRNACFAVLMHSGEYEEIRKVFAAMRTQPAEVVSRTRTGLAERDEELLARLDEPVAPVDPIGEGEPDNLLDALAAAEQPQAAPPGAQLLNLVDDPELANRVAPVIVEVATELDEERRERDQHRTPLRQAEKALRLLESIELNEQSHALGEVVSTLGAIVVRAEQLAEEAEELAGD